MGASSHRDACSFFFADVIIAARRGAEQERRSLMTTDVQLRGGDQCQSCGKPLTINGKMRNRRTGLCWDCLSASPQPGAPGSEGT
jgi:hypothetical protein